MRWAAFKAILGHMWSVGRRPDKLVLQDVAWPPFCSDLEQHRDQVVCPSSISGPPKLQCKFHAGMGICLTYNTASPLFNPILSTGGHTDKLRREEERWRRRRKWSTYGEKRENETYRHVTLGVASIHSPSLVPSLLSGAGSWAATAEAKESPWGFYHMSSLTAALQPRGEHTPTAWPIKTPSFGIPSLEKEMAGWMTGDHWSHSHAGWKVTFLPAQSLALGPFQAAFISLP